jgi:predicted RNA polymerase sigma factor
VWLAGGSKAARACRTGRAGFTGLRSGFAGRPAAAVAYAEGPAAGLAILDPLAASSRLARWPQLHIARGALLAQCGRDDDAAAAYGDAIALEPAGAVRRHITGQIAALGAASAPTEET